MVSDIRYCMAEMFSGVNVWQIAELKVAGEKKFGEWINFGHMNIYHYKLKFGWLKFGETRTIRQLHQTFLLPNIPVTWYITLQNSMMYGFTG